MSQETTHKTLTKRTAKLVFSSTHVVHGLFPKAPGAMGPANWHFSSADAVRFRRPAEPKALRRCSGYEPPLSHLSTLRSRSRHHRPRSQSCCTRGRKFQRRSRSGCLREALGPVRVQLKHADHGPVNVRRRVLPKSQAGSRCRGRRMAHASDSVQVSECTACIDSDGSDRRKATAS